MSEISATMELLNKTKQWFEEASRYTSRTTSLTARAKPVTVMPMVVIDDALRVSDIMPHLNQSLLCLFAGFYLQAIAIATAEAEMQVQDKLEPFGTDVSAFRTLYRQIGQESFTKRSQDCRINPFTKEKLPSKLSSSNEEIHAQKTVKPEDVLKAVNDKTTLDVGKIVTVTFKKEVPGIKDGSTITKELDVPVAIRLHVGLIPANDLISLLSFSTQDMSAAEREAGYRTGRLSFFADIIFCRDVYKRFRRSLMRDSTGFFRSNIDRLSNSALYKMTVGDNSGISSIVVVSSHTARALEDQINIKLDNYRARNDLFSRSGTMILVVVDDAYRVVRYYFHDIERPMEATFKEIERKGKKDDNNIAEIMAALAMGNTPRL